MVISFGINTLIGAARTASTSFSLSPTDIPTLSNHMAFDGTMTLHSRSSHHTDTDTDTDTDTGYDDHHRVVNLPRLSVSRSSCMHQHQCVPKNDGDHSHSANLYEIDGAGGMSMFMSQLSIDSFEGDADDEKKNYKLERAAGSGFSSSSSDSEPGYYSLPTTPPRIRRKNQCVTITRVKVYASENEAKKCRRKRRRTRVGGHRWVSGNKWMSKKKGEEDKDDGRRGRKKGGYSHSGGESENNGVMYIARPKGGKRSLCMDLDEVKACKDLGFELELEMPSRLSISATASGSAVDTTSSGANSPIAHWRISSPGDNPRDVKARLKIWAQAVALASTTRPTSD